jgi:hypothetical protein
LRFLFLCDIVGGGNNSRCHQDQRLGLMVEYLSSHGKVIVSVINIVSDLTAITSFSRDAIDAAAACSHAIQMHQRRGANINAILKRWLHLLKFCGMITLATMLK